MIGSELPQHKGQALFSRAAPAALTHRSDGRPASGGLRLRDLASGIAAGDRISGEVFIGDFRSGGLIFRDPSP